MTNQITKADVYSRVTSRIVADLEKGVRPWLKPWSAGTTQGGVTRPLRHNGEPYRGINILLLWGDAIEKGFIAETWITYKQAMSFGAHVRKGEQGSLVVYADRMTESSRLRTTNRGRCLARDRFHEGVHRFQC